MRARRRLLQRPGNKCPLPSSSKAAQGVHARRSGRREPAYSAAIRNRVKVVSEPINRGLERLSRTVKRGRLALKAPKQEAGDARVESVDDGDNKPPIYNGI